MSKNVRNNPRQLENQPNHIIEGDIMIFNQKRERVEAEMKSLALKIDLIKNTGKHPKINKGFRELNPDNRFLVNHLGEEIPMSELFYCPKNSVQILPKELSENCNTPFGSERSIIVCGTRSQDGRLTPLTEKYWGNLPKRDMDKMRHDNLVHLFSEIDNVATDSVDTEEPFILTHGSGGAR